MSSSAELSLRLALGRLRERRTWAWFLVALLASALVAAWERDHGSLGAADRALLEASFGVLLPLLAYLTFDAALAGQRLDIALRSITRFGGDGREAGASVAAALATLLALAGSVLGIVAVLGARGLRDPELWRDLWASIWIGALAGLVYAAWFTLASTLGKRGGGRTWLLILDWVLGASSGFLALPWPRAHVRNLLGGLPPLELGQGTALTMLLSSGTLVALVTLARVRR